jgi:hypothetical protein
MNITLKRTDEQVALVKAMASKNRDTAYEAQAAVAEFMGPILAEVVNNAPSLSSLFTTLSFDHEDNPSIPLDLYYDITDEDYITIWSQNVPGGLPTNTVVPTQSELKFTTYRLDSAIEFDKKYAQRSRLDVVSKSMTRLAQEILLKQERTSANLILGSLFMAQTNSKGHVLKAGGTKLGLADFNNLLAHAKRIHSSWSGGTPTARSRGITDIVTSPEIVSGLRALAFNPVYESGTKDAYPATDEMRKEFYNSAGVPDIYGISIMELNEMGVGQRYNDIWAALVNASASFDSTQSELVLGVDRSRESLLRGVAVDADYGSEFQLNVDDQYSVRQSRIGYYGAVEEGRMVLDDRALTGITVCDAKQDGDRPEVWSGDCVQTDGEA